MRIFNTSGPCDPTKHYTVMREALVAQGQAIVEQGRYFTIFAPRQAGKTTYFQLLFKQLQGQGYTPIWISFEGLKTLTRAEFYQALTLYLHREFASQGINVAYPIENQIGLQIYLGQVSTHLQALVLIIDEFEDVPPVVLDELMHTLRAMYQKRQYHKLHALALVGVSTIAEMVLSSASPFNVVDELRIPYFTFAEVQDLIGQHVTETGQPFEAEVVEAIYANTQGQPGLTCALCHYLVTEMAPDRTQPITMAAFQPTLTHFLTERLDKNIVNIVQKAREKQDFILQVLFSDTPIPFNINEPSTAYLYAHGVIDNIDGYVDIPIPLYSKTLIAAFRPPINGEAQYYVSAQETFKDYISDKKLNLHLILTKYRDYIHRRGFRAFNTEQLKEGAWHYSLDGFINFFIEQLGGDTFIETPSGRGRTDILILYQGQKSIIETKIFVTQTRLADGKAQLADYLEKEKVAEGYFVVFSNKHSETDTLYFEETINGKRIYTYIILTDFERPSRHRPRQRHKG
ncbi:MAG: AAA-like domain-containing protein [Caldilineaceae bacterium]